jgi:hypothetical protein
LPVPGHYQEHITLHHPLPQFPQRAHSHFIDVTGLCLFCILFFFHRNRSSKKVIFLFLSKEVLKKTKYSRSRATFIHANCVFFHEADLSRRCDSSERKRPYSRVLYFPSLELYRPRSPRKLCLPHSYCNNYLCVLNTLFSCYKIF